MSSGESDECDVGHFERGGAVEGAVSGAARDRDFLQRLAAGSGAADADEQSGSGGCRAAGRFGRLWGNGQGGTELGKFSRDCEVAARACERRNSACAIGETGGGVS